MEQVFRALGDPSRRLLLDKLFERDGQTLHELVAHLEMSRFGVMKHLKVLEEANLVVTRKVGREKHHYLNPVPIRELQERWVSKFAEPWVSALTSLKATLEAETMADQPKHVFQVYIRCTPERLWETITTPKLSRQFFSERFGPDFHQGADYTLASDDEIYVQGTILEVDPPRRLVMTWDERHESMIDDPVTRVTWEIEPDGDICKLTLTHDDFESETETFRSVGGGWPKVLSSLKSLIETGEGLPHD